MFGGVRHEVDEPGAEPLGIVARLERGRVLEVVRRQEGQEIAHVLEARLLVRRYERGDARLRGVAHRAAELFERDVLTGDGAHDVGTGDEHVRALAHHEDEVGHGGAVNRATGARAEHHRDLRHHTAREHVAVEDPAVRRERDDALLDAGAGAVVQADHGRADLERDVHQLVDLLGEHLAERAAEHGEVLAEHEDLATVDRAPSGDHTVGVGMLLEPGSVRAMTGEQVELVERARVEQEVDALAGEHLALRVLPLDRSGRAGLIGLGLAPLEVLDPLSERVIGHEPQVTGHHVAMIQVVEGRIDVEPGLSLVAALLDELRALYGEEDDDPPSPDDLAPPKGRFWVVVPRR